VNRPGNALDENFSEGVGRESNEPTCPWQARPWYKGLELATFFGIILQVIPEAEFGPFLAITLKMSIKVK
jgi:hypothetical protein